MKRATKHILETLLYCSVFFFAGCQMFDPYHDPFDPTYGYLGSLVILDQGKHEQVMMLLESKCASCHGPASSGLGGLGYITDVDLLVTRRKVIPGDSPGSPIYYRCADGSMPPGAPLSDSEVAMIADWIDNVLVLDGDPGPDPGPSMQFPPNASDLTKAALTILNNRCASCHNAVSGETTGGGVLEIVDPRQIVISGLAKPGNSSKSPLYRAIIPLSKDGNVPRMPKAPAPVLGAEEVETIRMWIDTELTADPEGLPDYTPKPLEATYSSIRMNVLATRCVLCHGGSRGTKDGKNYSTYSGTLGSVKLSNPSDSKLYTCLSDGMPQEYSSLSSSEKQTILNWISSGAPNN
ncbi:MAG: hypothetical protein KDD51_13740 [Bdellovibrionales bacterium]|nr:hypothetical protein [Bdellovibrionales bacterium]